jgi:hypothetical protein
MRKRTNRRLEKQRRIASKKSGSGNITEYRLFRSNGKRERVLTLDANSETFTQDLTSLFRRNVARVRRERRKRLGASDRVGEPG